MECMQNIEHCYLDQVFLSGWLGIVILNGVTGLGIARRSRFNDRVNNDNLSGFEKKFVRKNYCTQKRAM